MLYPQFTPKGGWRYINRLDQVSQVNDGLIGDRDGSANGRVRLQVTTNEPIIVRNCQ